MRTLGNGRSVYQPLLFTQPRFEEGGGEDRPLHEQRGCSACIVGGLLGPTGLVVLRMVD